MRCHIAAGGRGELWTAAGKGSGVVALSPKRYHPLVGRAAGEATTAAVAAASAGLMGPTVGGTLDSGATSGGRPGQAAVAAAAAAAAARRGMMMMRGPNASAPRAASGGGKKRSGGGFVCSECGERSMLWKGRCGDCDAWGTLEEVPPDDAPPASPRYLHGGDRLKTMGHDPNPPSVGGDDSDIGGGTGGHYPTRPLGTIASGDGEAMPRLQTGVAEFDAVLGGGLPHASFTLLGGPPGIGKSTLM